VNKLNGVNIFTHTVSEIS